MILIDSHSHIHFSKEFPNADEVLERARRVGVLKQVIVGCSVEDSLQAAEFVAAREGLAWTIGVHPHDAKTLDEKSKEIIINVLEGTGEFSKLMKKPVAIGECGLDYYRNLSPVEDQKNAFKWQLELAKKYNLPVVVHVREAFEDAFKLLDEVDYQRIVFHCFSGGMKEAKMAWKRGFVTSFSGVVTYPKNAELQEVAKLAPENSFIVETDCPFLSPQKYRGQKNEPAFVVETAKFIGELRGQSLEKIAELTTANVEKFFKI
ncbi:MAG: TatD family hydrolase [Candidatus Altimarinota bacterium]